MRTDLHTKRLTGLRYSNSKGQIIPMHHAFLTVNMPASARITSFLLPVIFLVLIWLFLPSIIGLWADIFAFWTHHIYGSDIAFKEVTILRQNLMMPAPALEAAMPDYPLVYWNLVYCIIGFILTFLLPMRIMPITYLLRACLLIQSTASLDQMISPENFPYTLPGYLVDALSLCVYLLFVMPVVLGFVYYIFDFGLIRKLLLTLVMLAYFLVMIPCQYMLHAVIIYEHTLLFLPLMYLVFGTLLDVLMFVSIYSVGMSLRASDKSKQGRVL